MDLNDHNLALRIKNDDRNAFRELFENYAPRIYRFALSYIKNADEAEELVQDVFLKIWEKRNRIDVNQNFKSFIFTIAVNSVYDVIRHRRIEQTYTSYTLLHQESEENTTWNSVTYHETQQRVHGLLKRLPKQQQAIFNLSKIEGLSNDEIGLRMGISKRTVENNLYRAVAFMKQNIKNESAIVIFLFSMLG